MQIALTPFTKRLLLRHRDYLNFGVEGSFSDALLLRLLVVLWQLRRREHPRVDLGFDRRGAVALGRAAILGAAEGLGRVAESA